MRCTNIQSMFTESEWWDEAVSRRADSPAFSASRALWQLWQGSHPGWWGTTDLSKIIPSITRGCECCSFSVLSRGLRLLQATTANSQASPGSGFMKGLQNPERKVGTATATPNSHKISAFWVSLRCFHQLWGLDFFHRAVKNQWDLCCKLLIMTGKALQWNWFV